MRLHEIKTLGEQALETKTAEDLWSENEADVSDYVSTSNYQVRPVKGSSPTQYEVFTTVADQRKLYGKFNAQQLNNTLKPIRPNQTPDAEGFTTYVDPVKVSAFAYSGDPVKLELGDGLTVTLNDGDYVVRTVKGSSFLYNTEAATDFETNLKKA
jgi:hypothetical protein